MKTVEISLTDKGNGLTVAVSTSRTTNTVDIVLGIMRHIVIDDSTDIVNVYTTCHDIGVEIIETELILKDLDSVEKRLATEAKAARMGGAEAKARLAACEKLRDAFQEGKAARTVMHDSEEMEAIVKDLALLTAKPLFYCANVKEDDILTGNAYVEKLKGPNAEGLAFL